MSELARRRWQLLSEVSVC